MKILTLILITLAASGSLRAADEPKATYPLATCVVSGKKLGSMGAPYVFVYKDTEVHLCCEYCRPKFDKDPAKYLEPLKKAAAPQS